MNTIQRSAIAITVVALGACSTPTAVPEKEAAWNMNALRTAYAAPLGTWPKPELDEGIDFREMQPIPESDRSEYTALEKLGIRFFHEPRFSASMSLSCASCHRPNQAFTENSKVSTGHDGLQGSRNSPTLYGAAEGMHFFWDGSAASLEEQALGPIANPVEMAMPITMLETKLQTLSGYEKDLEALYGDKNLTTERIAEALAAYERTIVPPRTRYDRFLEGETDVYDDRELLGLHLFRTKARCMNCHNGPMLSDNRFHNLGLTFYGRKKHEDFGRYAVTEKNEDMGRFKTPILRQIAQTGPYMHNGLFPSLKGVVKSYNVGMFDIVPRTPEQQADPRFPKKSPHLEALHLTLDEQRALIAFLETL